MPDIENLNFRQIKLESERVVLKEIPLEYRHRFYEIFSDREVLKFTDRPICTNIDEAILYLNHCNKRAGDKEHIFLGIFLKSNNDLEGVLSIYHIDIKHSFASLGILLAREYWRQGIMTEALKTFLYYYFLQLNFNRIELQTFVKNIPAIKLFEKLQFKKEGELRQNFLIAGEYENSYLFSMLKSEFEEIYVE